MSGEMPLVESGEQAAWTEGGAWISIEYRIV